MVFQIIVIILTILSLGFTLYFYSLIAEKKRNTGFKPAVSKCPDFFTSAYLTDGNQLCESQDCPNKKSVCIGPNFKDDNGSSYGFHDLLNFGSIKSNGPLNGRWFFDYDKVDEKYHLGGNINKKNFSNRFGLQWSGTN